jgi:pimeloyl-ACP methyl ester carboxylesterase
MQEIANQLMRSTNVHARASRVYQHRTRHASDAFASRLRTLWGEHLSETTQAARPMWPWEIAARWQEYAIDACQRSILFWDTMRQRGKQYVAHELAGKPPVLHFDYEMVLDARRFQRPVNYALVRITPPEGVTIDEKRRPYVIIDPRAGHGPGIGGFKDDSQVGVALREGHPVYFVIFYPEPEPGQTMIDVCVAEQAFVRRVHELHPDSPKPVVVGNCQGGWAAMMVAASSPDDTGAIVINGAPMSYWSGAWTEGAGNNPMRYAGGLLGGTWLASLTADLGNGLFDGAYLVQNFESLDPANTYWDKYYHVFANADTEPPRFLEFERWWSGYYLMNREEIEWITKNLFVGNRLWDGETKGNGVELDLRSIRSPIVMFASLGDNITPPQQAFNWVADVYASTDELKAGGQVIVGLLHQSAGHLALFVSGKVAKREHTQLVSVLKSIEALPPGLYGMRINEAKGADGKPQYEVDFLEHTIEEIQSKLNRFERVDEKAFEAVGAISELNQRAYELFARPLAKALGNETSARLTRFLNPLRVERWAFSDMNPWLSFLDQATSSVKQHRQALEASHPLRKAERMFADTVSATLDLYKEFRDAAHELSFFELYGTLFSIYLADRPEKDGPDAASDRAVRQSVLVKAALDGLESGGYAAALARVAELLAQRGTPVPLARIERKAQMVKEYADVLPDLSAHEWKLVRAQQGIIVRFEPEQALATLPRLLADPADRERFLSVVERIVTDREFAAEPSTEQLEMAKRIRKVLGKKGPLRRAPADEAAPDGVAGTRN